MEGLARPIDGKFQNVFDVFRCVKFLGAKIQTRFRAALIP